MTTRVAIPLTTPGPTPPAAGAAEVSLSGPTMGVEWSVKAILPRSLSPGAVAAAIQGRLDIVVAQMSTWEPASAINLFNRAPAGAWMALPPELFHVLSRALALAEASDGAFDPTIGRLVSLWGFGPAGPVAGPPSPAVVDAALGAAGWGRLTLDPPRRRARQPGGLMLDLSGIAKGYGVDEAARALEGLGVRSYLIEIGGELRGLGIKPGGEPWWVQVEAPPDAEGAADPILVALHGLSIATSGDYRRYVMDGPRRLAHTLDPHTGRPCADAPAAVSVLHPECMQADALCTLLTVLGAEAGLEHCQRHGIAALFRLRSGHGLEERMSPAFAEMLA